MRSSLFRNEVLSARQAEWLGSIRAQAPRPGWLFFGFALSAMASVLALLVCGHYTRHEQVGGVLVPSGGLLTIMPVDAGVVERVLVKEGDRVRAGQSLVEISGEQGSAALGDTHAAIEMQLQLKRDRLKADLVEQQSLAQLRQMDLFARRAALKSQIEQLDGQIAIQIQRASGARALYTEWSKYVASGVISKFQVLQQNDVALQNEAQVMQLQAQHFQLKQQAEELRGMLSQLPASSAVSKNDTDRQMAEVAQSLAENAVRREAVLRATADGTVVTVLVHPGQAVTSQQSVLTVLPNTSTLIAELWVPPESIGFVRKGEAVVIRYQAYPYQKFGQYRGYVSEVSRSAVSAAEISRLIGQDSKEPRFRVRVALDSQHVLVYEQNEPLKPGMTLDADILLDRRRLIEWVLEPLSGFAARMRGRAVADRGHGDG